MKPCMTEAEFRAYLDAFNAGDEAGYRRFYAEDVVLVLGGRRELKGPQAIIDFYKDVTATSSRRIALNRLIVSEDGIAAELESTFTALADLPDLLARPLKAGETYHHVTFVLYDVAGGQFTRIRSARYQSD